MGPKTNDCKHYTLATLPSSSYGLSLSYTLLLVWLCVDFFFFLYVHFNLVDFVHMFEKHNIQSYLTVCAERQLTTLKAMTCSHIAERRKRAC